MSCAYHFAILFRLGRIWWKTDSCKSGHHPVWLYFWFALSTNHERCCDRFCFNTYFEAYNRILGKGPIVKSSNQVPSNWRLGSIGASTSACQWAVKFIIRFLPLRRCHISKIILLEGLYGVKWSAFSLTLQRRSVFATKSIMTVSALQIQGNRTECSLQ